MGNGIYMSMTSPRKSYTYLPDLSRFANIKTNGELHLPSRLVADFQRRELIYDARTVCILNHHFVAQFIWILFAGRVEPQQLIQRAGMAGTQSLEYVLRIIRDDG